MVFTFAAKIVPMDSTEFIDNVPSLDVDEDKSSSAIFNDDASSIHTRMSSTKSSIYSDDQMFATKHLNNDVKAIPSVGLRRARTTEVRLFDIDKRMTDTMKYHFATQTNKISKSNSSSSRSSTSFKSLEVDNCSMLESMYFNYEILSVSYISESYSNLASSDFSKVKHLTDGKCSHYYHYPICEALVLALYTVYIT